MPVQRFDIASLAARPWKNGGGSTREIVSMPAGAGLDDFDWRVSIASVVAAGPFSVFAGVDRVIMLLDGDGLQLRSADGRIAHRLDTPHQPFAFAGDAALHGEPLGGASTDLNVMVRRSRLETALRVLNVVDGIAAADGGLLLALRGRWRLYPLGSGTAEAIDCEPGQGVWWDGARHAWLADPLDDDAALASVRLDAVAGDGAARREAMTAGCGEAP